MDIGVLLAFVSLVALVFLGAFKVFALMAGWPTLSAAFPMRTYGAVFGTYKKSIAQVGRIDFEGQGQGTVILTDQGFHLRMANPFMRDILVPFGAVTGIREISVLGHGRVTIDIAHERPLRLSLPREAIQVLADRIQKEKLQEGVALDTIPEFYQFVKSTLASHFGRHGNPRAGNQKAP